MKRAIVTYEFPHGTVEIDYDEEDEGYDLIDAETGTCLNLGDRWYNVGIPDIAEVAVYLAEYHPEMLQANYQ